MPILEALQGPESYRQIHSFDTVRDSLHKVRDRCCKNDKDKDEGQHNLQTQSSVLLDPWSQLVDSTSSRVKSIAIDLQVVVQVIWFYACGESMRHVTERV